MDRRKHNEVMKNTKQSTNELFNQLDRVGKVLAELKQFQEAQKNLREKAINALGEKEKPSIEPSELEDD